MARRGVHPEDLESSISTVEKSITVNVPLRTAYDQWTQFESFPEFMEHVDHVRQLDTTSLRWTVSIGDADRTFDADITEQVPDQRIAWKATGDAKHAGVVTFHHLDPDTTRIMLQMEIEPTDWVEKAGDFFGAYSSSVEGDLERFKAQIEERGEATGSWRGTITRDGTVKQPDGSTGSTSKATGNGAGGGGTSGSLAQTDDTMTRDESIPSDGGSLSEKSLRRNDLREDEDRRSEV